MRTHTYIAESGWLGVSSRYRSTERTDHHFTSVCNWSDPTERISLLKRPRTDSLFLAFRASCLCCLHNEERHTQLSQPGLPEEEEAIRWSQYHSCQWHSVLCSSSCALGEWEASSSLLAAGRPPPAVLVGPRQKGWTHVWLQRKGVGSCRCCCDSSAEAGCSWLVWSHRSKAPGGRRCHSKGGR